MWVNKYGCTENYRFDTVLYLMPMLSQVFSVIIDHVISTLENYREFMDGLNTIDKRFLFELMLTVQLPGVKGYETQMVIYTGTRIDYVSFSR